ncbi:uncharacterized protein K02A2.6-like [Ostrea edulis]|uniref:uncharacterized protein K02A2.6-like n=1 Tax=Ostrea edulis TaxID=37623 RepID=UPI0024AF365D|nr:uncharacterized protein K02A2.6-like [Ostrea edulis]
MGIEKCLQRARSSVFWPRISADITTLVSNCDVCLKHRYSNSKEPLQPHPIPDYPWQVVAIDLFEWDDKNFLIVSDYYSRFFEVVQLRDTKSKTVIQKLKSMFSRLGIPQKVISDNGPQYSSQEFATFATEYDFVHATSSPRHPQSNGLAEKTVQIAKRIFEKSKTDGRDPYLGILEYRTTPLDIGYSPSELLLGRQLRSVLPVLTDQLIPKVINHNNVKIKLGQSHAQQKFYFDRQTRPLPPVEIGDSVLFQQNDKLWKPATIISKVDNRSYIVGTPNGGTYRRNRAHLLKTNEANEAWDPALPIFTEPSVDTHDTSSKPATQASPCKPAIHSPKSPRTHTDNNPYITRSGRVSIPKIKPSM